MGFLDFLRKKTPSTETVAFSNLEPFLRQYVERKNLGEKLQLYNQRFEELQIQLKGALETLQNGALPAISEEEVRIVQENREHYLERIQFFLANLHPPQTVSDLGYFTSKTSQDYDELLRSLEQNKYVLEQYLPKILAPTTTALKALSEHNLTFLTQLRSEHLEEVHEIQAQIGEYKKDQEKRQKFQQQKAEEESQLAPLKEREEKILRRLDGYKKTPAYEDYQTLLQQKQPLVHELQKERQELQQGFLHLSYALRKYHYEAKESLVQQYLDEASEALQQDPELNIARILSELHTQLQNLDLKEDKEVQALNTLPRLTAEYFSQKRAKLQELGDQLNQIQAQLGNSITALNVMEQESLLSETKSRMVYLQENIQELGHQIEELHEENYKNKIKELIINLGNVVLQDE
ncbi:MAG: hypothetical protein AABX70_07655 [Nanoarchaeota archaeon]